MIQPSPLASSALLEPVLVRVERVGVHRGGRGRPPGRCRKQTTESSGSAGHASKSSLSAIRRGEVGREVVVRLDEPAEALAPSASRTARA